MWDFSGSSYCKLQFCPLCDCPVILKYQVSTEFNPPPQKLSDSRVLWVFLFLSIYVLTYDFCSGDCQSIYLLHFWSFIVFLH